MSEQRYRTIFENTGTAMGLFRNDNILMLANSELEKLTGYEKSELENKLSWHDLTGEKDLPLLNNRQAAQENKVSSLGFECHIVNKAAEKRDVFSISEFIPGTDLLVVSLMDITARKQAETEKEILEVQNRQLQKSESLGRMAGAIAHHFNNQLGVVIANLEMAIEDLPRGAGSLNKLTAAMQAAENAAEMSGLMLTYLGHSFDKLEPLDLSHSCRKMLPILKADLPENVIVETDFSSPCTVINTNPDYMKQILTNLITNAREAIGKNSGTIFLRVKTVSPAEIPTKNRFPIDWQPQDIANARLEVTDTGSGITDKDMENLFDPFYSTKFTGRGMGLAVVLGILKTHKGVLTVDSKPKLGSTFRVFFPLSEVALSQPQKTANNDDALISAVSPEEGGRCC